MLELLVEALEGAPCTGEGAVELGVEPVVGAHHRQYAAQSLESPGDAREFAGPLTLGPRAQACGVASLACVVERLDEQLRVRDEAFAGGAVGAAVVGVPTFQLPGRQRMVRQRGAQRACMLGVGAANGAKMRTAAQLDNRP